jgi:hypothetical protein
MPRLVDDLRGSNSTAEAARRDRQKSKDPRDAGNERNALSANKKGASFAPCGRCNFTLAVETAQKLARVLTLR